jgi:hypothetical protein
MLGFLRQPNTGYAYCRLKTSPLSFGHGATKARLLHALRALATTFVSIPSS